MLLQSLCVRACVSLCDIQAHTKDGPLFAAVSYLRAHAEHYKIVYEQMGEMVEIFHQGHPCCDTLLAEFMMCSLAYYLADMAPSSHDLTLNRTRLPHDRINVLKKSDLG